MKKIGIITWHHYPNFGGELQAYALQTHLRRLGYTVRIIDYRPYSKRRWAEVKYMLACLLSVVWKRYYRAHPCFMARYFSQTRRVVEHEELVNMARQFDAVICGADQIWAPNVFDSAYMLDFVPEKVARISYAASVGLNDIPEKLRSVYQCLLSRFHRVSVRESMGATLLKNACGIDAEVVLDPTLLIEVSHWEALERKVDVPEAGYLFCYFLNAGHCYREATLRYARAHNLKIVGISRKPADAEWMQLVNNIGPREFLYLIHHARAIYTDSYHGAIFSLLYHKDFMLLERFLNTDAICQNSRIYQLRDWFNLQSRIVPSSECAGEDVPPFDYEDFEKKLCALRQHSMQFLTEALEN